MSSSKKSGGKTRAGKPPEASDAARPAAAAKKSSLPAFGFAADLLKGRGAPAEGRPAEGRPAEGRPAEGRPAEGRPAEGRPAEGRPAEGRPAEGRPAEGRPAEGATPAPAVDTDPDRVFAFADSLAAGEIEEQAKKVRRETWVTLTLASETFALPVSPVREVLRISSITRVPHAPYPIRGVTNLRGRVIPVLDLRIRLELPEGELTRMSRIIVVSSRGRLLGLLVDAVHQVVHLDVDRIHPPPEDVMTVQSDYISGVYHVEQGLVLLLDVDRALVIRDAPTASAALLGGGAQAPPAQGATP